MSFSVKKKNACSILIESMCIKFVTRVPFTVKKNVYEINFLSKNTLFAGTLAGRRRSKVSTRTPNPVNIACKLVNLLLSVQVNRDFLRYTGYLNTI